MEERELEIANRMKNLIWTVCGDYTLEAKPDVDGFLRSKYLALYDGIKQGAFARYFDKEALSLYLVKKIYLQADEASLMEVARLCMEEAVGQRIAAERKGVESIRRKAYEYVLEHDLEQMVGTDLGRLKIALMRRYLTQDHQAEKKFTERMDSLYALHQAKDTMEVIQKIDSCYNAWVDPEFVKKSGGLERVLAVTLEELSE